MLVNGIWFNLAEAYEQYTEKYIITINLTIATMSIGSCPHNLAQRKG